MNVSKIVMTCGCIAIALGGYVVMKELAYQGKSDLKGILLCAGLGIVASGVGFIAQTYEKNRSFEHEDTDG